MVGDFVRDVESILGSRVAESGKVLYSPARTLVKGDVYLLGSNPGGKRANPESRSIKENLRELPHKQANDFLGESWRNSRGRLLNPGEHYLQRRIQQLFKLLNLNLNETCSSNVIFMRSQDEDGVSYTRDANDCWEVHRLILKRVMPRVVLVFGCDAPFDYLWKRLGKGTAIDSLRQRRYSVKSFCTEYDGQTLAVVGFPHPSRFPIQEDLQAVSWIREQMEN